MNESFKTFNPKSIDVDATQDTREASDLKNMEFHVFMIANKF